MKYEQLVSNNLSLLIQASDSSNYSYTKQLWRQLERDSQSPAWFEMSQSPAWFEMSEKF